MSNEPKQSILTNNDKKEIKTIMSFMIVTSTLLPIVNLLLDQFLNNFSIYDSLITIADTIILSINITSIFYIMNKLQKYDIKLNREILPNLINNQYMYCLTSLIISSILHICYYIVDAQSHAVLSLVILQDAFIGLMITISIYLFGTAMIKTIIFEDIFRKGDS